MTASELPETTLRAYLLGELGNSERDRVEEMIFADFRLANRLDDIRAELVHDYVAGRLDVKTRKRYEATVGLSEQSRITAGLHRELIRRAAEDMGESTALSSRFGRFWGALRQPAFAWASAAALLTVGVFYHLRVVQEFGSREAVLQRSLAEAVEKSSRPVATFFLSGVGGTRGSGSGVILTLAEPTAMRLRTVATGVSASRFLAVLQKEDVNVWRGTASEVSTNPLTIEATVPEGVLLPGTYVIIWMASEDNTPTPVLSETFVVRNR